MAQETVWKTNEPASLVQQLKQKPQDQQVLAQDGKQNLVATLEPQRIRAFSIKYKKWGFLKTKKWIILCI